MQNGQVFGLAMLMAISVALTGCSKEPVTKEAIACMGAVMVIKDAEATRGMRDFLNANENNFKDVTPEEGERIGLEIRKEYGIDEMTAEDQRQIFLKIYNSEQCRAMHGQDEKPESDPR